MINQPNPREQVRRRIMINYVKTCCAPGFFRDLRIVVFPKESQRIARGALRWGVRDRAGLRPWPTGLRLFISRSVGSLVTSAGRPETPVRLWIDGMCKGFQWNPATPIREMRCMNMKDHVKSRGAPDFARDPRIGVFPKGIQRPPSRGGGGIHTPAVRPQASV